MKRVKKLAIGIFLLGNALSGAAYADPTFILYGDTVDFTIDPHLMGLFGNPSVAGDTLFFTPVNFDATSLNGAGYALTNDTINIKVEAHAGRLFSGVNLNEKGDYLLLGTGGTADVTGQVRVFDTAMPLPVLTANINTIGSLNLVGTPTKDWVANASVNVSAWNTATYTPDMLNVTVENLLITSTSMPVSLAFLEKKFVGVTIVTTPVPEAETYSMILAGLGLVGFMVTRRRQGVK